MKSAPRAAPGAEQKPQSRCTEPVPGKDARPCPGTALLCWVPPSPPFAGLVPPQHTHRLEGEEGLLGGLQDGAEDVDGGLEGGGGSSAPQGHHRRVGHAQAQLQRQRGGQDPGELRGAGGCQARGALRGGGGSWGWGATRPREGADLGEERQEGRRGQREVVGHLRAERQRRRRPGGLVPSPPRARLDPTAQATQAAASARGSPESRPWRGAFATHHRAGDVEVEGSLPLDGLQQGTEGALGQAELRRAAGGQQQAGGERRSVRGGHHAALRVPSEELRGTDVGRAWRNGPSSARPRGLGWDVEALTLRSSWIALPPMMEKGGRSPRAPSGSAAVGYGEGKLWSCKERGMLPTPGPQEPAAAPARSRPRWTGR